MQHIDKNIWMNRITGLTGWDQFNIDIPVLGFPDCREFPVGWMVSFTTTGTKGFPFDVMTIGQSGRLHIVPSNAPGVCFSDRMFCLSDHSSNNPCNAYFWHSGDNQWRVQLSDAVMMLNVSYVDEDSLLFVYLSYNNQIESCLVSEKEFQYMRSVHGNYVWVAWREDNKLMGIDKRGAVTECELTKANEKVTLTEHISGFLLNTNPLAVLPADLQ